MKYALVLLSISILFSCNTETNRGKSNLSSDNFKDDIELSVKQINKNLSDSIIIDNIGDFVPSCNGAELIGYLKNDSLVKIKLDVGMSSGIMSIEYFFRQDSLIYINERNNWFYMDSVGTLIYDSIDMHFSGHYYFQSDSLMDIESIGHNRFENDSLDIETTLLNESAKYKLLIRNKAVTSLDP